MAPQPPVSEASNSCQASLLIDAFVKDLDASAGNFHQLQDVQSLPSARRILGLPRDQQVAVVMEALSRQTERMRPNARQGALIAALSHWQGLTDLIAPLISQNAPFWAHSWVHWQGFKKLISALLRKNLPFRTEDIDRLVHLISERQGSYSWQLALGSILRVLEDFSQEHGIPDCLRPRLLALRDKLQSESNSAQARNALQRLNQLLTPSPAATGDSLLTSDEAWTRHLRQELGALDPPSKAAWHALLLHCNGASQSRPSSKWLQQADTLINAIGPSAFAGILSGVLAQIGKPGTPPTRDIGGQLFTLDPTLIHDAHSDLLRGLIWCASLVNDDKLTVAVGDAAAMCFQKVPNFGPRSTKIGNACLFALSSAPSSAAVGQLSRLKTRAKHASIRNQLGKAIHTAAEKTGMTAAEMEEVAVPSCGLTEVGTHRQQLGDLTAVLTVSTAFRPELTWLRADGKKLKSVPASVKETFAAEVRSLKQCTKEITKLLPAQRDRLEQLFLQERSWSLPEFRSRYLDHPLVGILARRLIWRFFHDATNCDGIWLDGQIVDHQDKPLGWLGPQTRVTPWHPLTSRPEEVRVWREWLDRHQVRQPFKQAHREIYLLTDAERRTETYSNRFAAHILRQHQFSALCQQRGWRYRLQGNWDSQNTPTLVLAQCGLRAEFWVESLSDAGHAASGIHLYLSTDQVRFYREDEIEPMPLAEVPPLVFSEVLRDVDLFVGVASVGNDPNWSDGGPTGQYRDYWQGYSFGDLSATTQTRKVVLESIVPRLKIAGRCSFDDKFLIVRGNLRTYQIHLGSGNILMAPNNQYLCIVPTRSSSELGGKVFLPFEGDTLLSIIVSKALLLAEDSKIKDPTIMRQIKGR